MDQLGIKVLACFPDLNSFKTEQRDDGAAETSPPSSAGRIINQALAFKLLSAVTLLLLAVAVFPLFSSRADRPAASPSATDASLPWQAGATAGPGETTMAQSSAPRPATVVPATPQQSLAPVILPPPPETAAAPRPTPSADVPLVSSRWPNPAHAVSPQDNPGGEPPRAEANQPMAVRPPEYQADARAGNRPDNPAAPANPNSDKSVTGDRYDRTRPSARLGRFSNRARPQWR